MNEKLKAIILVVSVLLTSCGIITPHLSKIEKMHDVEINAILPVIISKQGIPNNLEEKYLSSLSSMLGDAFQDINISDKKNEPGLHKNKLVITTKSLRYTSKTKTTKHVENGREIAKDYQDTQDITAFATIQIKFNEYSEEFHVSGHGEYTRSLVEGVAGFGVGLGVGLATLGTLDVIKKQNNAYSSIALSRALKSLSINFCNKLVNNRLINKATEIAKLNITAPAELSLTTEFDDKNGVMPNNTLDANEESQLLVTISNTGPGIAFSPLIDISNPNSDIVLERNIVIGDISPGDTKEIKVPLKTAIDLKNGATSFVIQAKEKRGFDSKRVVMKVPTAALEKPELLIGDYRINDGNTGFASGNGNGIPENGETIEITPIIKNNGVGKAIRIKVSIASVSNGIEIKEKGAVIPELAPGETASAKLALHIPTTYSGGAINVQINAVDVRGNAVSLAERQFALNTEVNRPVLAYSWRLLDKNGKKKEYLNNGEEGEIEIQLRNTGKLEARNINIAVKSAVASFGKTGDSINRIAAETEYAPIRFPFTVPRAFEGNTMDVTVRLEQKYFPGLSDPRSIPVRLVKPDLKVSHQVLSPGGSNALKQGENAEIVIRVDNTGQLDAEQAVLTIDVSRKGILMKSPNEVNLGRIETGKSATARFSVFVQRSTEPGSLPVQVSIAQKTFAAANEQIALSVLKEQDEIITVKGEEHAKPGISTSAGFSNISPVIVLAHPRDNARVASESILLSGVATAVNGFSSMEIRLNGRLIDNANRGLKQAQKTELSEKDINEQISLQPGKNEITVTVYDNKYLSKTKTVTVFRETRKGNVYAAVIGLNKYQAPGMNLKYARNDAESFASYMRTNMGLVNTQNLFELYDEKATMRGIKSLLGTRLRQLAKNPEDTVYIYFAGHGAPEQDSSAQDEDKIRKYLLAYDMEPSDLYGTTIPMDEVARIISSLNADRVIFIMDACYSGEAGGRTMLAKGTRAVLSEDFLNRMTAGKGRIILTSSKPNETSQEDDNLRHGYFTYNLLEGLKGKADYNGDNVVDIDEIAMYLNKTVPEQTGGKQHPVKKGEAEGQVIVGKVR